MNQSKTDLMRTINEIQIIPIKPQNGLVAFCSFILFDSIYCSSVGIFTKIDGSYRLVYPTKKVGIKEIDIFHPINKQTGKEITEEVIKVFKDLMNNDRYNITHNT